MHYLEIGDADNRDEAEFLVDFNGYLSLDSKLFDFYGGIIGVVIVSDKGLSIDNRILYKNRMALSSDIGCKYRRGILLADLHVYIQVTGYSRNSMDYTFGLKAGVEIH